MLHFIRTTGLFFWPIAGILVLVVALAIRDARRAAIPGGRAPRPEGLLFWGAVAAVLGFLGQCLGLYNGLRAISRATEISPAVVAEGVAQSFQTTFCGLAVLLASGVLWLGLRTVRDRRTVASVLVAAAMAGSAGAAGLPELDGTAWMAEADGERYVFVFGATADGQWDGMSHSLSDGRQYIQCPLRVERWQDGEIEFVMRKTGVRYRGAVDTETGRIEGGLVFDEGGMDFPLTRIDAANEPGLAARAGGEPYTYAPPPQLDDGWAVEDAAAHGLTAEVVSGVVSAVCDGRAGLVHAVLVDHGGALVVEEYFHGYDREALHPLASVTKSVSGLLVGMALAGDGADALQRPLLDFFPGASPTDERWRTVTVEHLLTMSIGLDWNDEQAESIHGTGEDFFAHLIGRGFVSEPGAVFRYVNANVNLISGVVLRATGTDPEAYAAENLFAPLGIEHWDWSHAAVGEHRLMDGSLQLRPRDMARIGRMMLDEGRWRGEQVVPAAFARSAIVPHMEAGAGPGLEGGYGYLWWTLRLPGADGPLDVTYANGWGSQFIILVPARDLVVVITGGNQDNGLHMAPQRAVALPLVQALGAG